MSVSLQHDTPNSLTSYNRPLFNPPSGDSDIERASLRRIRNGYENDELAEDRVFSLQRQLLNLRKGGMGLDAYTSQFLQLHHTLGPRSLGNSTLIMLADDVVRRGIRRVETSNTLRSYAWTMHGRW